MGKKIQKNKYLPEDAIYIGLGIASLAKKQFNSFISMVSSEGKMLAKDREKFKKDLIGKGEKYYKTMMKDMEKMTSTILKKMNIPSRKEFEALKRKVEGKKKSHKKKK